MTMKTINRIFLIQIIALFLVVFSCTKTLTPENYIKYYEKNKRKYCFELNRNGLIANVFYNPPELFAAREMLNNKSISKNEALEKYEEGLYFILSIRPANNEIVTNGKINRIRHEILNARNKSGHRNDDITMVTGTDSISALGWNYEKNWGLSNENCFTFFFPKTEHFKNRLKSRLIIRNMFDELGTLDIKLADIVKPGYKLRG